MRTILVAGAGKSSVHLIKYLLTLAPRNKWKVVVADGDAKAISSKINGNQYGRGAVIDITSSAERANLVKQADMVLSLMPPDLHIHLAKDCLEYGKNLITSSYMSAEMKEMNDAVKEKGLMFMCEMGLDPGLDHMTANKLIHGVRKVAGSVLSFKSYCGGLIAPENDNNPWHYKFTWNPANVIAAGKSGGRYLNNGHEVEVAYDKLFKSNKRVKIEGVGSLAYYPNRDSMSYIDSYDIPEAESFIRATLRHPAFCAGWQAIITLGLTDDTDMVDGSAHTLASWIVAKNGLDTATSVKTQVAALLEVEENNKVITQLSWLGLFEDTPLQQTSQPSSAHLLSILLRKWEMAPQDKDMVVMQHEMEYLHRGVKSKLISTMTIKGENRESSAMSRTVGLPMGVLANMVMNNKIRKPTGVLLPNMQVVYRPMLTELAHHGISFVDEVL